MSYRLLRYSENNAVWNMAVDEAILEAHRLGLSPPTLRFYGWAPPAISFGYAQKVEPELIQHIIAHGFEVVRRPTGGRAVLHEGDLTYAFIGSSSYSSFSSESTAGIVSEVGARDHSIKMDARAPVSKLSASVSASYLQICEALIAGLSTLGVKAEIGQGKGPYTNYHDCFQTTTTADLQVGGLKIVGSAQLRRKQAVLQHGSLLLAQDQTLLPDLLSLCADRNTRKNSEKLGSTADLAKMTAKVRHCNLFDLIGHVSVSEIEQALVAGFQTTFGVPFEAGQLTTCERQLAEKLVSDYRISALFRNSAGSTASVDVLAQL